MILQAIQTQMQQVIIDGVTLVLQELLEQEVTTKLGRSKCSPRRVSSQPRAIDWCCAFCGSSDANQFTRDGHYRRRLETGWGHLDTLRVSMLECQQYQHDVVAHFAILDKYQRFWLDAPPRAIFSTGLCQSLRYLSRASGSQRSDQTWDCAPLMSGSTNSKSGLRKPITNPSGKCQQWCSLMASGPSRADPARWHQRG